VQILKYALSKHPIIASVMEKEDLDKALATDCGIVLLMKADIGTLKTVVDKIKETDKLVFSHVDMIGGIKRDKYGIKFLADDVGLDGIVSTHPNLIKIAQKHNLLTIQRVFILDTASIRQGVRSINESNPDAVEVLPGIAVPHIKDIIEKDIKDKLVIAGGLINTEDEIVSILKNGASGVSSSARELWSSNEKIKSIIAN